ncbi:MAG: 4-aminobutyrate--2-oxoglutarate transaminase [Deltaproteobacteria bacterium]|nr:4-aminobutyrate--2-oxoglutarate transaminase [Deltaproteobacteria bacterium]
MNQLTTQELRDLRQSEVPQGPYNITPLYVQKAYGAVLEDTEGKRYIDFAGGIGVENVGHGAPEVVKAIKAQVDAYIHPCFHVAAYEPYLLLARELNRLTPGGFAKKTMFLSSGAEAVENAIKIARYATGRPAVVTFENAYHGRTYMAMTLTSQGMPYKKGFGPFCPEVYRAPFAYCYRCAFGLEPSSCGLRCADHLEDFFSTHVPADTVAAMIVEPIQGEGGFIVPPQGYLSRIHQICKKHGILLIADEIQAGMGRTGKLYACEHENLEPDLILTGKALGGGLPLTAVTGRAEIMDATHAGGLGGTFAGNPVCCRAGIAVLGLLTGGLMEKAQTLGTELEKHFRALEAKHPLVGQVRGKGVMWGMELVRDRGSKEPADQEANQVVAESLKQGLIVLRCGVHHNVIRTLMPLTVTKQELAEGFAILDRVLSGLEG